MAKILIAPMGAGTPNKEGKKTYKNTFYGFDDSKEPYESPFIADALAQELKLDKIYFIGTTTSIWSEVYNHFSSKISNSEIDVEYSHSLEKLLKNSGYDSHVKDKIDLFEKLNLTIDNYLKSLSKNAGGGSKTLLLQYGLNPEELWFNFDIFMEIEKWLNEGDELYLDITYSFRSIPLFMYLMLDFIQTLNFKNVKLKGIYYGMFECYEEKKKYTPIVDLSPLFVISQWIRATNNFIRYGNGFQMVALIEDEEIKESINDIAKFVNLNYLQELKASIEKLKKQLNNKNHEELRAFQYMIPYVDRFIERFTEAKKIYEFQLEVAKWFYENKKYSNAYICIVESILTGMCEIYNCGKDIYQRECVKNIFYIDENKKHNIDKLNQIKEFKELRELYKRLNKMRNYIAHASYFNKEKIPSEEINNFDNDYRNIKRLLNSSELSKLPKLIEFKELKNKPNSKRR